MIFTGQDIKKMERIKRLTLINAITGIKPANVIGTISPQGICNLAIFSSVVHLGSNLALLGFILRPVGEDTPGHTYRNLLATKQYTINQINSNFIENAHYTSAKFETNVSEFEQCRLTPEFIDKFTAPFVQESSMKIGMRFIEEIPIKINNTRMIIGEVEHLIFKDKAVDENGLLNLEELDAIGISGLDTYYSLKKIKSLSYAHVADLPSFQVTNIK